MITGTVISSAWANNTLSDIANALTASIASDGQTPITGDLDMGGNTLTDISDATLPNSPIALHQITDVTGAALVGSTGPSTVQADLDAADVAIAANAAAIAALSASTSQLSLAFYPSESSPPAMTVKLAAGSFVLRAGQNPITQPIQTTGLIVAPVGNPRIDRVVIDSLTGAVSVITGTPAGSPVAPDVPAGKFPVAQVLLQIASTTITNSMITDERSASRPNEMQVSTKTAGYTLLASDLNQLINYTGAADATLAFTAAATLGSQWSCIISNASAKDVTLDPNGAELIDGLASYIMYPGESRLVLCSGTAFTTKVLAGFARTFTSSGTFTSPPGYQTYECAGWGGGGSGGSGTGNNGGGGGGGGAYDRVPLAASLFGTSQAITIGAGGVAATTTAGNVGGNTTVGSLITWFGGGGGGENDNSTLGGGGGGGGGLLSVGLVGGTPAAGVAGTVGGGTGGIGGTTSGGAVGNSPITKEGGSGGGGGSSSNAAAGGVGGNSVYAGGGGGGGAKSGSPAAGAGGSSSYGGAGGAGAKAGVAATAGTAPAGGGGGTGSSSASGAGARGEVRIYGTV